MHAAATNHHSAELPVDPETAYAFLTDLDYLPEWYPGLTRITNAPADGPHRGSRFTEHRRLAPGVSIPVGLLVTKAQPGVAFHVIASRRGIGSVEGRYDLEPIGPDRTRVTVTHRVVAPTPLGLPAARAVSLVLARDDRRQLDAMPDGVACWRGEGANLP